MKQNPLILPLVGGGVALLCFFLPWIKIDMSSLDINRFVGGLPEVENTGTISGFMFALGGDAFMTLSFLATLVILGVCIYMLHQKSPWKSRIPVLISSGFGFLCVSIGLFLFILSDNIGQLRMLDMAKSINIEADVEKFVSAQFWWFAVAIGFFVALIGAWNIPKSDISMEDNHQEVIP